MKKVFALMGLCGLCACSTKPKEYTFDWRPIIRGVEVTNWNLNSTYRGHEVLTISPDASSIRVIVSYIPSSGIGSTTNTYYFDDANFSEIDNSEFYQHVYVHYKNGKQYDIDVEHFSPDSYFIKWHKNTFQIK